MNEEREFIFLNVYFPRNISQKNQTNLRSIIIFYDSNLTIKNDLSYIYLNINKFPY